MSARLSPPVLARLRASTRLIALVLLVFLMKIGMVAACATHDVGDAALGAAGQTASAAVGVLDTGDGGKAPEPLAHGGCIDCHCHHAAALVTEVTPSVRHVRGLDPPVVAVRVHGLIPGQELRPPIF